MLKILLIPSILATFAIPLVSHAARDCSPAQKQKILETATKKSRSARVNCHLHLNDGEMVTKNLYLVGASASGIRISCDPGGVIGSPKSSAINAGGNIIQIKSKKTSNGNWSRPENITIENCRVNGGIKIMGMSGTGEGKELKESSRSLGHTERAQAAAPKNIVLKNLVIKARRYIPVYFAPGVTHSKLLDSHLIGSSRKSVIYLDAESAHNTVEGNVVDTQPLREIVSIDGSAHNRIANNVFRRSSLGGVFIYRNCGEGGTARHQKPMYNEVVDNRFFYNGFGALRPTIWVSFKNLPRLIFNCPQDRHIPYGSGKSDLNYARRNTISGNQFKHFSPDRVILNWGRQNTLFGNITMQ